MDFKTDENLPIEIAQLLTEAGHSVSTALDEGLGGATDEAVSSAAVAEGQVLVTLDPGFADIRRYPPASLPGIIVLRLRRQDKPHLLELFRDILPRLAEQPLKGRLWIVEEDRIRIRS